MSNRNSGNKINFSDDIKFAVQHIGGSNDDSIKDFNNQTNIIKNNTEDYERILNYFNKLERDKNNNDDYVERLDNEQHTTPYRINNFATYIEDVNYSNPIIYPKEYDMYFDYLQNKNLNPINTQVVKRKEFVNIDSANRNFKTFLNIEKYISLEDGSLEFYNQKNYFRIYVDKADELFEPNNFIILRGLQNYNNYYQSMTFFFTNGSNRVIIDLKPNYITTIPYYDILIKITGVSNGNLLYWKNIPIYIINQLHKVYIIGDNNDYRLAFDIPINFYSENELDKNLVSECNITFFNIGNYPINLVNANTPLTANNLDNYLIVSEISTSFVQILLSGTLSLNENIYLDGVWSNGVFRTGKNIQIGKINSSSQGYANPNNYSINLNKTYNNVAEIKMVSSEIPNVQKNITVVDKDINSINSTTDVNLKYIQNDNNKLYWQNIEDVGIYMIELLPGFYNYDELKRSIESTAAKLPRNIISTNNNAYKFNVLTVDFDVEKNLTKFNLYNIYILPNCLENLNENIDYEKQNSYTIRISQPNHNFKKGDRIFITGSIDYYFISNDYINSVEGHIITNVINNNFYEIKIDNINKIDDVGNTKGGYGLQIKSYAIFRMFFNFKDTFGKLIGFKLTGEEYSITSYTSLANNYTITNIDKYYYDISQVLIINGNLTPFDIYTNFSSQTTRYMLLLLDGINLNNTPNGPSYFYKFLLNGLPNTYLYNTFVNSPVFLNPPIKSLNQLNFTFINPDGGLVNFGNLNHSFTLEITTLSNLPENTNLTTFMSRM
jgi:hypothetical protein